MTKTSLPLVTLSLVLLLSCEGNTTREWFIDNQSNEALTAKAVFKMTPDQTETIEIAAGSQTSLGFEDVRGGQVDAGDAEVYLQSLSITSASGKTVQKDFTKESSWEVFTEHRHKVPSDYYHSYTMAIADSDLE